MRTDPESKEAKQGCVLVIEGKVWNWIRCVLYFEATIALVLILLWIIYQRMK